YLHDQLAKRAARVVVAHPRQLSLIYRSKRKNDRVDAQKLAKLLHLDLVPRVHVPSIDTRTWRSLIEFRQKLLGRRTGVKNQLRAILRGLGIAPVKSLWSKAGVKWLAQQDLTSSSNALQRDLLLEELSELSHKIARVEKELKTIAASHPA